MRNRAIVLIAAALAIPSTVVRAQTIAYSTFGPGDSYNTSFNWAVGNILPGASPFQPAGFKEWLASSFTYQGPIGGILTSVRVAAGKSKGALPFTSGNATVDLLRGPSIQSASLIESWTLSSATNDVVSIYSLTSIAPFVFDVGQVYWIRMRPADVNTLWGWAPNSQGVQGLWASTDEGGTWFPPGTEATGTFDVRVKTLTAVPEPESVVLFGSGLLLLMLHKRGRRKRSSD